MKYILSIIISLLMFGGAYGQEKNPPVPDKESPRPVHVSHLFPDLRPEVLVKSPAKNARKSVDEVGDEQFFWVYNFEIQSYEEVEFRLIKKGNVSQIWFEIAEIDNGHLDTTVADSMFKYLEEVSNFNSFQPEKGIVEQSNEILGSPPNYDGDGLSDFFVTNIHDGWTPDCRCGYTAGFFNSVDQVSALVAASSGQRSNERDVLYIDSYPGIYQNNAVNAKRPLSTLAHEYQHLIHYNYNSGSTRDYTFINEAQSNFASLLNGYFPHPSYLQYLQDTNVPIFRWNRNGDAVLKDYGRAASFSSYLWDEVGFEHAGTLTQSPFSGAAGVNDALIKSGSDMNFAELLVNWGIANLVNNSTLTGTTSYAYSHPFLDEYTSTDYPTESLPLSGFTTSVEKGGIAYVNFEEVKNMAVTVNFSELYGEARIISIGSSTIEVDPLQSGQEFQTRENQTYENVFLIFVNTEPSGDGDTTTTKLDFTVNADTYESTSVTEDPGQPVAYALQQNYPNPFNPSTQITFTLPEAAPVQLTVFDINGREISRLADRRFTPGTHRVNWDASGLSSGIYFYRLKTPGFSQTKKMLLLK